ncbi:MAG: hypothetical protein ACI8P0_006383 [Planctomycetaceae bacterium]|jgi:hypothetical protein
MEHVILQPTGLDSFQFDGELLMHLAGPDSDRLTGGRWHDIDVYGLADGSFALSVNYRTTAENEHSRCMVDTARDVSDADAVLSLYDPKEFVVLRPDENGQRVTDTLVRQYDTQVIDILNRLQKVTGPAPASPKPR